MNEQKRNFIMKSRTDPSKLLRRWLRATWRSLLLLVLGGLLGAAVAGGLSAPSGKAGSTASMADAAGSHASKPTGASSVPVPTIDKLREQAISRITPVVVEVTNVGKGLGSGVILTRDGYIVTNNHVVAGASRIRVTLSNGKTVPATLRGYDPVDDLAVLKISYGKTLPTVAFGNSDDLKVGEEVLADGNPLGIIQTVTNGIVSALHRVVAEGQNSNGRIYNAVQTSAPINPGNSGGALINLAGQLVGIPTLTAVDPEFNAPAAGVGFAIPSNRVKDITSQIIKYGKVRHSGIAALGIGARNLTPLIAQQLNLPVDHGVVILGFARNSPAQKAGLTKGDVIVTVANTDITSFDDLLTVLATKKPGDAVKVTAIDPNGHKHTYTVKLNELDVYASS
jgi:S1-C subfamily serine protease